MNQRSTNSPIDLLLSRLHGVSRNGKGHVACCPAHKDRKASLSITLGDDGRVLAHCFAGCSIAEIANAAGMAVSDLFPPRAESLTEEGRQQVRQAAKQSQWRAALNVLEHESNIVLIAATETLQGELSARSYDRLQEAVECITQAREVLA